MTEIQNSKRVDDPEDWLIKRIFYCETRNMKTQKISRFFFVFSSFRVFVIDLF
ncbi:hypothetical protein D1AOALGA4SA_11296 [Olavius algarvensis Delta 1 endosymbiont]|nr:hypothetical protein D1AOALGA4SA_11296 [Olavius algarvensis Delta 1 endosymbiont]